MCRQMTLELLTDRYTAVYTLTFLLMVTAGITNENLCKLSVDLDLTKSLPFQHFLKEVSNLYIYKNIDVYVIYTVRVLVYSYNR